MTTTRHSFLSRLRKGGDETWMQLHQVYRPLIVAWLRRLNLRDADLEDVAQEVMLVILRRIEDFDHNGRVGAFRNWLRAIASNTTRSYLRKKGREYANEDAMEMLTQLEDPGSELSKRFDREHDQHVLRELLQRLETQFEPSTIEVFRMNVLKQVGVKTTAEKCNTTPRAVYIAKSRVLRKLREEAADWVDDILSGN